MSDKKTKVQLVWETAQPIAEQLGLQLWDIRLVKEGTRKVLRIIIDKDDGVSMEDCVNMSHALDEPLDELDPIDDSYSLQVSSPGVERELVRDEHFSRFIGAAIMVKFQKAIDGKKEFKGHLVDYDRGMVTMVTDDEDMHFDKKECSYIKLDDFEQY